MTDKPIAMELRRVQVAYNGKPVLDGVSAVFPANAAVGVIGPSGAGKSTLLRTLSRMNDRIPGFKVRGHVLVDGQDIYGKEVDVHRLRQKVGTVFQTPCMFPKSILENVVFGLKHQGSAQEENLPEVAEQVLRRVMLWDEVKDRLHKPAPTLSLGQQQRLAIARTLAVRPSILLMDEPTSALDPKSTRAIEELVLSLKKDHTIVMVTHNLAQVQRVCGEVICLYDGKVCEAGTCEEFFSNPSVQETQEYLDERRLHEGIRNPLF
jgi:phosphate transport system ATP-binding protein